MSTVEMEHVTTRPLGGNDTMSHSVIAGHGDSKPHIQ